jgi:hypothetical protein
MKLSWKKHNGALYPADERTQEAYYKLSEECIGEFKKARNPYYHRMAFSALRTLYDMVEEEIGFDPWRKMLTIEAGYFVAIGKVDINGVESAAVEAESLSFENMDDLDFKECFNNIIQAFIDKYGRQITYDQLMEAAKL